MACAKCERGNHDSCTGYDGPITTNPDSLPRCPCPCPQHKYDLATKTCGCGKMMWPDDYAQHLGEMNAAP